MNKIITISILGILLIAGVYALYNGMTKDEEVTKAITDLVGDQTNKNAMNLIITSTNLQIENRALKTEINRLQNKPEKKCGRCQPQNCPTAESCPTYEDGDANHDGEVNVLDKLTVRKS